MIPAAQLRSCPECGGSWPKDPDHALRGCGWLGGLPRRISPNNGDVEIHDGAHGRDRFLRLEIKGPRETWPIQPGQARHLRALANQPGWTIRVLRGTTAAVDLYRVTSGGIAEPGIHTHAEAVRRAVESWLNGSLWRDAEASMSATPAANHTHGWARVDGLWTCIQDFSAVGFRPETGCGETLPEYP
jgi:hypothetical protein